MTYIHPADERISDFAALLRKNSSDIGSLIMSILAWFDENVGYSRLSAPFFPLQRSDLDVLEMKAGTCGDYSNLIVSVLTACGYDACYAYVHRDCYGDAQDHICAAVKEDGRYILIDATQHYRKFHGFGCPHREFELLSPDEFESRMKEEEEYWTSAAERHGKPLLAGIFYAPWIHAEPVFESDEVYDEVFYLLILDDALTPTLYAYYMRYTPREGALPIMASVSEGKTRFHFSIHPRMELWDNEQWCEGFDEADILKDFQTEQLRLLKASVTKVLPRIEEILGEAGCRGLLNARIEAKT